MAQLVAGRTGQPGPAAGAVQDLIQPVSGQRHAAARALEHHEHLVRARISRALSVEIGADLGEEPRRDRDQPLVAALALGDEDASFPEPQVTHPQPEDLAAAQSAQHHRRDHGPVPVRAQRRGQRATSAGPRICGSVLGVRTSGTPWPGRCRSRRVGSPRGTGFTLTSPRACKKA